jgi:hypothetical protein
MAKYEFQAEILEAGVNHVVPSYAPFCDTYLYLQESTEADWNALTREIGIYELGVLESTGAEIVYEADGDAEGEAKASESKKSVIDKIVAFIKAQWEKVKGAFDNLLKKIQEKAAKAKEKFSGNVVAKIKANLDKGRLKETDKDGVVKSFGKFAPYEGLDKLASMSAKELKGEQNTTDVDVSLDDLKKKYRGTEFDVERQWIASHVEDIVKYAFDFKFTKRSVLSSYNEVKKGFDEEIKKVKVGPVEIKQKTEHAKAQVKTLNKIASAAVQLYIERQSRALGLLTKVAVGTLGKSDAEKAVDKEKREKAKADKAAAKEAKKAEKTNESGDLTINYSSEIERLFDWNF